MPREPQSYGSGRDWVSGRTDQEVNDQKSEPAPEHREFYDERRESDVSLPDQGGKASDTQLAESAAVPSRTTRDERTPISGVTGADGGAKRGSFFRKRDYE